MAKITAFVSSHHSFKRFLNIDFHNLACDIAGEFGISADAMGGHEASEDLECRSRESVRDADVLILLLGWKYGSVYDGGKSMTEIEYDTALEQDKHILVFIYQGELQELLLPEEHDRIAAFRQRFEYGKRPLYAPFRDVVTFSAALRAALSRLIRNQSQRLLIRTSPEVIDRARRRSVDLAALDSTRVSRAAMLRIRKSDPRIATQPQFMREVLGTDNVQSLSIVASRIEVAESCFPDQSRLIVTGAFGCGKSNFLELLELKASINLTAQPHSGRAPLYLDMSRWSPEEITFRAFLEEAEIASFGSRVAGNDLFLLLDEIDNRAHRLDWQAFAQVVTWISLHPRAWVMIASRHVDEGVEELLDLDSNFGFNLLGLEPLGAQDVMQFFERNTLDGPQREALLAMVENALSSDDEATLEMLTSPFNLKLLSGYSFGERPFPDNEVVLQRAIMAASFKREAQKSTETLSLEEYQEYIGRIAADTLLSKEEQRLLERPRTVVPRARGDAYRRIAEGAKVWTAAGGDGHLIAWTGRLLGYFCTEFLLANRDRLEAILPPPLFSTEGERRSRRLDPSILDVVRVDADLIANVARCDPFLAGECVFVIPEPLRANAIDLVTGCLVERLKSASETVRSAATHTCRRLGASAVPHLTRAFSQGEYWLRRRIIWVLQAIDDLSAMEFILCALGDQNKRVVAAAESALLSVGPVQVAYLSALLDRWDEEGASAEEKRIVAIVRSVRESSDDKSVLMGAHEVVLTKGAMIALEMYDEPMSGRGAGEELLLDLRSHQQDALIVRRAEAWLHRTSMADRSWPLVWCAVWDQQGDNGLESLGRSWLSVTAGHDSFWGDIWRRVAERSPRDAKLSAAGRHWLLCEDPAHPGWPNVLRIILLMNSADEQLTTLGIDWLRENASRSENNGAWSRLWCTMWSVQKGSNELRGIGRAWLEPGSAMRAGWSFIWCELWSAQPRDPNLRDLAIRWLDLVPDSHPGWGQVWVLAWQSGVHDPRLEQQAIRWLRADGAPIDHGGWPWVFGALMQRMPEDEGTALRGQEWLRDLMKRRNGWAHVWRSIWSRRSRTNMDPERESLLALASTWIATAAVAREGFSQVWEILWNIDPSPSLKLAARDHLWQFPEDTTLMYVWNPLSKTGPHDVDLSTFGMALLRDRVSPYHAQWNAIWVDLWNRTGRGPEIRAIGMHWLRTVDTSAHRWGRVWQQLWDSGVDESDLAVLGIEALRARSFDLSASKAVWRSLLSSRGPDDLQLVAAAIDWLRKPESRRVESFWVEVAKPLEAGGRLPQDLTKELQRRECRDEIAVVLKDRCERINSRYVYSAKWRAEWENAWHENVYPLLVHSGIKWLKRAVNDSREHSFPHLWNKVRLSSLEQDSVTELGTEWLKLHSSSASGWGLVWGSIMRVCPRDPALIRQGVAWLEPSFFKRRTWNMVWLALFDEALAPGENLEEAGIAWLALPNFARRGYSDVWCRLWDVPVHRDRLRGLAAQFLWQVNFTDGWIDVLIRTGLKGIDTLVPRDRVIDWLTRNEGHPHFESIREVIRE